MNTDPMILAFALAMHKEAQERAQQPRVTKVPRTARRAIRPATTRGLWRRPRRAPLSAKAGGTA
jgi:hypothetical protein